MRELFRGWKRKAGGVTLVMAFAVMGLWLRCEAKGDTFTIIQRQHQLARLVSRKDGLRLEIYRSANQIIVDRDLISIASENSEFWAAPFSYTLEVPKTAEPMTLFNRPVVYAYPVQWWFKSQSFGIGQCVPASLPGNTRLDLWILPFWSIVLPLTLLSAWLLLSKPRRVAPKQTTDISIVATSGN